MANNVTNWVWENSRAENGALIVLLAIAHEAGRDGEAEISALQLAAKCRLGERTVQTAVRDLVAAGDLQAVHGGGRGRQTRYVVPVRNPAESAPLPASNPAESAPFTETPQNLRGLGGPGNPAESAPFADSQPSSDDVRSVNPADSAGLQSSDVFISTTGRSEVPVKDVSAIAERPDVDRLCHHLAERVTGNGSKPPAITRRWRDSARLMIDRDGRTEEQIHRAIDWSQDHEFWRANILSMPKLREKYDQLRLQATRPARAANGRQSETDDRFRRQMSRAEKRMEAENDTPRNGHPGPVRAGALPAPGHG